MEKHNVFVYGTLRQGERLHSILEERGARMIFPEAAIRGFQLYNLGPFPGIVRGKGRVKGEMYKVFPLTLEVLDRVEGTDPVRPENGLYRREEVEVYGSDAKAIAWVYIYNHLNSERDAARLIQSGDWLLRERS